MLRYSHKFIYLLGNGVKMHGGDFSFMLSHNPFTHPLLDRLFTHTFPLSKERVDSIRHTQMTILQF